MTTLTVCPHCESPADTASGICAGCRKPIDASSAGLEQKLSDAFGERYELVGRVGAGAFGEVYRARDQRLDRDIALKQVRLDGRNSGEAEEMRLRSMREAKMAAKLLHPNIVTVHDVVDVADSTLILMEYVDGTTLEARLREGRLGFEECLGLMAQTADALDHAHEQGVVHRDIKPANLMIDRKERIRITDFGIAKTETGADITATGNVLGTPYYMSPEQARGAERLDGRADLFSLGCVIYECLAGYKPFQGKAVVDILLRLLHEPPASLDCEALEIPGGVPEVLHRAMAKDAEERYGTARELIDALRQAPAAAPASPVGETLSIAPESRTAAAAEPARADVPKPVVTRREPGTVTSFDIEDQGSLADRGLADVLGDIHQRRRTGILHVESGSSSKRVYFHEGAIVFANSDVESDRLGRFLIRGGIIDESTYESASSAMERSGQRLGRALVDAGQLSEDRVESLVAEQVQEIIFSMFRWTAGHYGFEALEPAVEKDLHLDLSTEEIILDGVRKMVSDETIRGAIGSLDRVPSLATSDALVGGDVTLSPSEGYVLSRIDGQTSVAELMAICSMGEEETLRCVCALASMGAIRWESSGGAEPEPEPRPVSSFGTAAEELGTDRVRRSSAPSDDVDSTLQDIAKKKASIGQVTHYELLEISRDASHSQVKAGFFSLTKRYHPDRHRADAFRGVQTDLENILIGLRDAYDVLGHPVHRVGYDSNLPPVAGAESEPVAAGSSTGAVADPPPPQPKAAPDAEGSTSGSVPEAFASPQSLALHHYRAGKIHYEEEDYHEAVQSLREAVRLDDEKADYHRMLGCALAKNPRWKADAVKHFTQAIELAPFDTASYVELARLYDEGGLATRAKKVYEQVLELNPDHEVARERVGGTAEAEGSSSRWLDKTGVLKWLRRGKDGDESEPEPKKAS